MKSKGIPVYAVALQSKDFNPKALGIVANSSGGRLVPVERSSQLGNLFEGIAKELSDVWTVTYEAVGPRPKTRRQRERDGQRQRPPRPRPRTRTLSS